MGTAGVCIYQPQGTVDAMFCRLYSLCKRNDGLGWSVQNSRYIFLEAKFWTHTYITSG